MRLSTHLTFHGQCAEAFRFYQRVLGGSDLELFRYGDSPLPGPPDWIVHASLTVGGQVLAGADVEPFQAPQGFFVLLGVPAVEEAQRVFAALSEGGESRLPLQKTFWSPAFGVLVDRFGIPWEVSCDST